MLSILVLVFLSCNMHGTTLRAKRGSNLCATAQEVMLDGLIALAALSLHLSFSGWPYGPTCHTSPNAIRIMREWTGRSQNQVFYST